VALLLPMRVAWRVRPAASRKLLEVMLRRVFEILRLVREPSAKALKDFNADPNVQKWLRWTAENDSDSAVRKEAAAALLNKR
jgi:hypothetical protein